MTNAMTGRSQIVTTRAHPLADVTVTVEAARSEPPICVVSGARTDHIAEFGARPRVVSWWWLLLLLLGPLGALAALIMYGIAVAARRERVTLPVTENAFFAHNRRVRAVRAAGLVAMSAFIGLVGVIVATPDDSSSRTAIGCFATLVIVSLGCLSWLRARTLRIRVAGGSMRIANCSGEFAAAIWAARPPLHGT